MTIKVNPPQQLNIPAKILEDEDLSNYFSYQQEIIYKLWLRTGGGTDSISENQNRQSYLAQLNFIQERIGSGDALTSDETGFTVDSGALTVDMTEA